MLIKCIECELQVSDKAVACPHCGCPLKQNDRIKPSIRKTNKKRRLPNGFGQISELKNRNLRNPFRVMVTVGKTETGKPISKLLQPNAYFRTYNEAYEALLNYNKNPYDIEKSITVKELYNRWSDNYFKTLKGDGAVRTIRSAWSYCSSVYDLNVSDIRARHVKFCIEEGTKIINGEVRSTPPSIKTRIKSLFNMLLDYAVEYEIVDKNYSRTFNLSDKVYKEEEANKKSHITFTDEEMNILWDNIDTIPYVDAILIQCYSGWRPQEMCLLKLENIDLEQGTFIGGIKTEAGTNRTIPIHSKIYHMVERKYNEAVLANSEYLLNAKSLKLTYGQYRYRFSNIIEKLNLNMEHRPHDPRMQFITMAKKYKVDEYAIKYIVGHNIDDITEKVYTQRDIEWLKTEIENIK